MGPKGRGPSVIHGNKERKMTFWYALGKKTGKVFFFMPIALNISQNFLEIYIGKNAKQSSFSNFL